MNTRLSCLRFFPLAMSAALLAAPGCSSENSRLPSVHDEAAVTETSAPVLKLAVQSSVRSQILEEMIRQYNAEHAGYQVEIISLPRERYDENLNMLLTSGQSPDVFQASPGWIGTYVYKNWLMDLSTVASPPILEEYPQWAVDYSRVDSHFYALPSELITLRLIFNKDLFRRMGLNPDDPPATLSKLKEAADVISRRGTGYGIYGFALPGGDIETYRLALETASTSSGLYYFDFARGQYDFTIYKTWFETMLKLKKSGGLFPGETTLMRETALAQFRQGNVGMMHMTNREYAELSRSGATGFESGIAIPAQTAPEPQSGALMVSIQHPFVISSGTLYRKEAGELWNYLHAADFLSRMYEEGELIPLPEKARQTARGTPVWLAAFLPGEMESPYPREPKFIVSWTSGDTIRMSAYTDIMAERTSPYDSLGKLTEQHNQYLSDIVYKNYINLGEYTEEDFDPLHPMQRYKKNTVEIQSPQ